MAPAGAWSTAAALLWRSGYGPDIENLPDLVAPFPDISSKAYEHPADRAATAALKTLPGLDSVVRKLVEWGYERALRQAYLANSVRVGPEQLSELWASHTAVCRILDMPEVYDLYIAWGVRGAAQALGAGTPMIVMDSSLLTRLGAGEQRVVLGHEIGHILSDHVLYMTVLNVLLSVTTASLSPLGLPLRAVRAVLLEWYRAAELSCDRASVLAVRDPRIVCRTLMVLGAGLPAEQLNVDAFIAQAMEYEGWDDSRDRARRVFHELGSTHPHAVRRVLEVTKWIQSGEYDRIVRGDYRRRATEDTVREDANDAMSFYAQRFRQIFHEACENIAHAGSQLGGVADQVTDWLRGRGGGDGPRESA